MKIGDQIITQIHFKITLIIYLSNNLLKSNKTAKIFYNRINQFLQMIIKIYYSAKKMKANLDLVENLRLILKIKIKILNSSMEKVR